MTGTHKQKITKKIYTSPGRNSGGESTKTSLYSNSPKLMVKVVTMVCPSVENTFYNLKHINVTLASGF